LARLPDVPDQLPEPRSARATAAGFADYRFDPPAGVEDNPAHKRQAAKPHVFHRSPRSDYRRPRQSPILPDSDPFLIPSTSLEDRLAPVARFLMLFLLFTVVGTTTMMLSGRRQKTPESNPPRPRSAQPATAASHQRLEPAPSTEEPPIDPLTAVGPLGGEPKAAVAVIRPLPKLEDAATSAVLQLATANGGSLPQVQTSELAPSIEGVVRGSSDPAPASTKGLPIGHGRGPAAGPVAHSIYSQQPDGASSPPAVANLPGFILQAPARQAQHGDDQSILH
jgi:hypothetical protein